MAETREAQTAHGNLEYDTVACKNCGNDIMQKDATYVGLDLHRGLCNRNICQSEHETYRSSVPLCEFCAENVLGYTSRWGEEINAPKTPLGWLTVIATSVLSAIMGFMAAGDPVVAIGTVIVVGGMMSVIALIRWV